MSGLQVLLESAAVNRLGWTLLHFVWQGAAVAAVLGLLLALLRRRSAGARYAAACGAMLVLAASPVVTFLLVPAPRQAAASPRPAPAASPAKLIPLAPGGGAGRAEAATVLAAPSTPTPPGAAAARVAVMPTSASPVGAGKAVEAAATPWRERAAEWVGAALARLSPALPWAVVAWGAGAVLFSVWNLGGWVAVRRLRGRATSPADDRVEAVTARLAGRMNLRRAVRVMQSAVIDSPLVIGALKPLVLVPTGLLSGLSPAQLESILAHELAHVRRHDYLVNLLQGVVETLLFYHPAVWWVSRRVRIEREHCCDDEAVRVTGDRAAYVRALAAVAESANTWRPVAAGQLAPAAAGGSLLGRVRRVMGLPDADAGRSPRWMAGLVALTVSLVIAGAVVTRAADKPAPPKDPDFDAPPVQSIELEVVDPRTNQPIPDVELSVRETGGPRAFATDDAGKARIEFKPGGQYLGITAKKPGFVPTTLTWRSDRAKDPVPPEYLLKLEPATTIGGVIQDEAGKPVQGADVSLIIDRDGDSSSTRERAGVYNHVVKTDPNGRWVCDVAPQKFKDPWIKLSHPDFISDETYGATPKPPVEKLRDMTGVMVMKKGVALAGRVMDKDGKPIRGADVAQGRDRFGSSYPSTKTGPDGRFVFAQARPGAEVVLTVKAKGYAPELKSFVLSEKGAGDLEIKLEPGRTLKGRVVDEKGNPIAGAMLAVDTWRGNRSLMHRQNTDPQGRFVWNEAPADEVLIDFLKQGYMDARHTKLTASDQEVTVTLRPMLKVNGTVVDAESGQPIPAFKIVQGIDFAQGQGVYWETRNDRLPPGRDGKFEFEIGFPRPAHAVRIEAEGYVPGESRTFKSDEGPVALEFRLKKGENLVGTLTGVDGKPLAGADVVLCTPRQGAYLRNGQAESHTDAPTFKSDAAGKFRLPPQTGPYTLAIVHERGYAEVPAEQFAKSPAIVVQPWGRVEGTLRVGSKPQANATLAVNRYDRAGAGPNAPRIYHDVKTTSDENGRFVFARVAPGEAQVAVEVKLSENTTGYSQSTKIDVKAGQTVTVAIGGQGRPVVGRVDVPAELKGKVNWAYANSSVMTKVDFKMPKRPDNWVDMTIADRQKWHEDWMKSPEGVAMQKRQQDAKHFAARITGDGTFRIEDVPAGTYTFNMHLTDASSPNKFGGEPLAHANHEFVVPEIPGGQSDEPFDVGAIPLKVIRTLKVGEPVPALEVKSLDGKPLKLADFRGKHVLVYFWMSDYPPTTAEAPKLKEAHAALAKDGRLEFLGLNADEDAATAKKFVEKHQLTWPQGHLGEWGKSDVPQQWGVRSIPSIYLVGPDGMLLAKQLPLDGLTQAVRSAMK
jgi:beta-lactamase regulating signal transducer with metallopeptidase domain